MFSYLRAAGADSSRLHDRLSSHAQEVRRDGTPTSSQPARDTFNSDTQALCATERRRRSEQGSTTTTTSAFPSDGVLLHWLRHLYEENRQDWLLPPPPSASPVEALARTTSRVLEQGLLWSRLLSENDDLSSLSAVSPARQRRTPPLRIPVAPLLDWIRRDTIPEDRRRDESVCEGEGEASRPEGDSQCGGGIIPVLRQLANPSLAALLHQSLSLDSTASSSCSSSSSSRANSPPPCSAALTAPTGEQADRKRRRSPDTIGRPGARTMENTVVGREEVEARIVATKQSTEEGEEGGEGGGSSLQERRHGSQVHASKTDYLHSHRSLDGTSSCGGGGAGLVAGSSTPASNINTKDSGNISMAVTGVPRLPSGTAKNSFRIKFSGYRAPSPPPSEPTPPPSRAAATETVEEEEELLVDTLSPQGLPPQPPLHPRSHPQPQPHPAMGAGTGALPLYEVDRGTQEKQRYDPLIASHPHASSTSSAAVPPPVPLTQRGSATDVTSFLSAFTSLPAGGAARSGGVGGAARFPQGGSGNGLMPRAGAGGAGPLLHQPQPQAPQPPQQQQQPVGRWERKTAPSYHNPVNKGISHHNTNDNNMTNGPAGVGGGGGGGGLGFITAGELLIEDVEAGRTNTIHAANFRAQQLRSPALGLRRSGFQAPFQLPNSSAAQQIGHDPTTHPNNQRNNTNNNQCPTGNQNNMQKQNNTNTSNNNNNNSSTNSNTNNNKPATGGSDANNKGDGEGNRFDIADYPKCVLLPDGTLPPSLQSLDPKLVHQVVMEIVEYRALAAENENKTEDNSDAGREPPQQPRAVSWDDIAGLADAKRSVEEAIVWPLRRPDLFVGLRDPPRGLLLFGPPGTGKTLIARAIASRAQCTFFNISAASLMSKWYGEAEQLVRCLFAVATVKQPSVIFVDEVDSLLSMRGDGENDAERRLKTEFLVQMDGVGTHSTDRVLLIGATNRPDELDEAARRRLEKRLYIPLPNSAARRELIQRLLFTLQQDYDRRHAGGEAPRVHALSENDLMRLVEATDGYSGADLRLLCREAAMAPLREASKTLDWQQLSLTDLRPLQRRDFKAALRRMKPSVGPSEVVRYEKWNRLFGSFGDDSAEAQQLQRKAGGAAGMENGAASLGDGGAGGGDPSDLVVGEDSDDDSDKEWVI